MLLCPFCQIASVEPLRFDGVEETARSMTCGGIETGQTLGKKFHPRGEFFHLFFGEIHPCR